MNRGRHPDSPVLAWYPFTLTVDSTPGTRPGSSPFHHGIRDPDDECPHGHMPDRCAECYPPRPSPPPVPVLEPRCDACGEPFELSANQRRRQAAGHRVACSRACTGALVRRTRRDEWADIPLDKRIARTVGLNQPTTWEGR